MIFLLETIFGIALISSKGLKLHVKYKQNQQFVSYKECFQIEIYRRMDLLIEIEALGRKEANLEEKLTMRKFFLPTEYKIIHHFVVLNKVLKLN